MTPEVEAEVVFQAEVSPSEDPSKVAEAVSYLAGGAATEAAGGGRLVRSASRGTSTLAFLRDQLRDRRIRAAARRLLLKSATAREATLLLNRQAAAAKVVALCSSPDDSPLGPVRLTLRSERVQEIVDWLAEYQDR